ncbi:MAG: pilus assembly protein PilM [Gemmataceae bacterium]|nr:pilus assembly protein PilM [Gemmataceae bacterium]
MRYLALDLDPSGLFVVTGAARGGAAKVEHALAWTAGDEHGPPALSADTAKALGEGLRDRLKAAGIGAAPALVAVGRDKVILKEVRFPAVPPSEEPALVRFQALKELTESPDEVVLDYAPLANGGPEGERRATVVAVRKDVFAAVRALCEAAGLKLAGVTPRPFAVAAGLAREVAAGSAHPLPPGDAAVGVLIAGPQGGEFTVVRAAQVAFTRSVPAPVLASEALLVNEVRRNLAVYAGQSAGHPVAAVYVAEPDDLLGGWAGRLRDGLNVPVYAYDPVAGAAEAVPDRIRGRFAGAAGLLAAKAADALPINFAAPRQPRAASDPNRRRLVLAAAVGGLVLAVGAALGYMQVSAADDRLVALREEKAALEKTLADTEVERARLAAADGWAARGVNYLDELFDMTDRWPAGDAVRALEFKGTPYGVDKNGKQASQARLEVKVQAKAQQPVADIETRISRDNTPKTKYYTKTGKLFGAAYVGTDFREAFTVVTDVNQRPPAEYTRSPAFAPPPRRRTGDE